MIMPGTLMQDQSASAITMPVPVLVALDDGHAIPIDQPMVLIGRSKRRAHVRIDDPYVSSVHCEIRFEDGKLRVRDCSRHGTRINGRMIEESELLEGDVLQIIRHRFRVESGVAEFQPVQEALASSPAIIRTQKWTPQSEPAAPDNWYLRMAGVELGPMPWPDLVEMAQSHEVTETDEVRLESEVEWRPASSVSGLFSSDHDSDGDSPETATWESAQPAVLDGIAPPAPGGTSPGHPAQPTVEPGPQPAVASQPLHVVRATVSDAAPAASPVAAQETAAVAPPVADTPIGLADSSSDVALIPPEPSSDESSLTMPTEAVSGGLADSSSDVALIPGEPLRDDSSISLPTESAVLPVTDESADDAIDLDVDDDLSDAELLGNDVLRKSDVPSKSNVPTGDGPALPPPGAAQPAEEADPANPRYFLRRKGRVFGPLEFQKLQTLASEGRLSQLDAIRTDVNPDWVSASMVEGLFDENSRDLSDEGYAAALLAEMDSSASGEQHGHEHPFVPEPDTLVPPSEVDPGQELETSIPAATLASLPPLPVAKARDDTPRKAAVDVLAPLLYLQAMFQTWPRVAVAGLIGLLALWMIVPGYSGAYVYGRVTIDGQPLTDSSITLTRENQGLEVSARVDADGEFVVSTLQGGMPTGKYTASFMPLAQESEAVIDELQRQYRASKGSGGVLEQYRNLDITDPTEAGPRQTPLGQLPPGTIPFKYRSAQTSDITVVVEGSRTELIVELKSDGS